MFIMLTHAKDRTPLLLNLDRVLYAYRTAAGDATVLVFGEIVQPQPPPSKRPARIRHFAVTVTESLGEIQEKRRMAAS
ncbi:MAG: hypothetical protein ACYS1C_05715 [Planctomycetota bacterium]